jgi:hypothetical protein
MATTGCRGARVVTWLAARLLALALLAPLAPPFGTARALGDASPTGPVAVAGAQPAPSAQSSEPGAEADHADGAEADEAGHPAVVRDADPRPPASACDRSPSRPCPLAPGETAGAPFADAGEAHAYRFFSLDRGARVRLELAGAPPGTRLVLRGWGERTLADTTSPDAQPAVIETELPAAGGYVAEVVAGGATGDAPYGLALSVLYAGEPPRALALAPTAVESSAPAGGAEGRFAFRTPRGGSPTAGLALARGVRTVPETELADFALVADVRFEQADGPAAATVRFRYQPEAGGGTGYLASVDPFSGEVGLDTFDEGQRTQIVAPTMHPLAKAGTGTLRLSVRANGPRLSIAIDGQDVLSVEDARFERGSIVLGVVTWSGPVAATFDNVLLTVPAS